MIHKVDLDMPLVVISAICTVLQVTEGVTRKNMGS